MNWTKDALFSKAKLFIEKAAAEDKDSSYYGIFSALALELLARAALANIHPTLLADADANQKNVLYALDRLDSSASPKSIMTKQVIALCGSLIPDFNSDLQKLSLSMTERRNEELHSGGAAFQEYNQDLWIGSFYKACQVLTASMGESLASFLGNGRAEEAETLISENDTRVKKEVLDKISARKKIYEEDIAANKEMLDKLIVRSKFDLNFQVHHGYHEVGCPCCGNAAIIYGKESPGSHNEIQDDVVIVKKDVIPNSFSCNVCGLKLSSYAELQAANLPLHYTNTYTYDPIEYFGIDVDEIVSSGYLEEYSNE